MGTLLRAGVAGIATGTLAWGGFATPAEAQPNIALNNLVSVQISNVLNNNNVAVTVPINAAANICGVAVNVLSSLDEGQTFGDCDARGNQRVTVTQ